MGVMALDAGLVARARMTFYGHHVLFFVALEADLAAIFDEQARLGGLVGIMTGGAFAIAGRIMFVGGFGDSLLNVIMAFKAQLASCLSQQFLVVRLMRSMTGTALAIFNRLMLHLGRGNLFLDIIMTLETQFPVRLNQ